MHSDNTQIVGNATSDEQRDLFTEFDALKADVETIKSAIESPRALAIAHDVENAPRDLEAEVTALWAHINTINRAVGIHGIEEGASAVARSLAQNEAARAAS